IVYIAVTLEWPECGASFRQARWFFIKQIVDVHPKTQLLTDLITDFQIHQPEIAHTKNNWLSGTGDRGATANLTIACSINPDIPVLRVPLKPDNAFKTR